MLAERCCHYLKSLLTNSSTCAFIPYHHLMMLLLRMLFITMLIGLILREKLSQTLHRVENCIKTLSNIELRNFAEVDLTENLEMQI